MGAGEEPIQSSNFAYLLCSFPYFQLQIAKASLEQKYNNFNCFVLSVDLKDLLYCKMMSMVLACNALARL